MTEDTKGTGKGEADESGKLSADAAGSIANSGLVKKLFTGLALVGVAWFGYTTWASGEKEERPKSQAEKDLDKIRASQQKNADAQVAASSKGGQAKVGPEQAQGDPESLQVLAKVRAEKEAEAKAQMDAEETAEMNIEQLHYARKVQLLSHDQELAARWEARMRKAAETGRGVEARALTEKEEQLVQARNPGVWANLQKAKALNGGKTPGAQPNTKGGQVQIAAGAPGARPTPAGAQGARAVAPTIPAAAMSLPGSIDPKTGLPLNAGGAPPAVGTGDQALVSGLRADGVPDIEGGAYPIQFSYVPVGEKNPVTATMWVKPGYLLGRTRPYNPTELQDADRAYRSSLKAPSEVVEKESSGVLMGVRVPPSKLRVAPNADFTFQQRYVVVHPNPAGVLDPPNPKPPTGRK